MPLYLMIEISNLKPPNFDCHAIFKAGLKERKILERHRKGSDQEIPEQITELTREKVSSHRQNMWEVSTNL